MEISNINSETNEAEKQRFYIGILSGGVFLLEKKNRDGYTLSIDDAGVFISNTAHCATRYLEGDGYLRFAIPVEIMKFIKESLSNSQFESLLNSSNATARSFQVKCISANLAKESGEEFAKGNDQKAKWLRELSKKLKTEAGVIEDMHGGDLNEQQSKT